MISQTQILIVDDDAALRLMLRGVLELNNYIVKEASNRTEALEHLHPSSSISIIILDLGLPPMAHDIQEGIAALKAIESKLLPIKVLVLTGQDQEAAALAAIRDGAFDFLAKPASVEQILNAIQRALLFIQKESELGAQGIARIAINAQINAGLKGVRVDAEERLVRQILRETKFNVNQSAKRLGVKRENIYYFLKKFGIARDA